MSLEGTELLLSSVVWIWVLYQNCGKQEFWMFFSTKWFVGRM